MQVRRRVGEVDLVRLLRCFATADRRLTVVVVGVGVLSGALLPAFALATGALVAAVRQGRSGWLPLAVLVGTFFAGRLTDPVLEEAGRALWRRVDESLSQRLMRALVRPLGLDVVEHPAVRDRLVQAQGILTDLTPGQAAYHVGRVAALVSQGVGMLAVVVLYRWWMAALLVAGYTVAYRVYRDHWLHVTLVLHSRTDRLRHAYYLRSVALEPAAAKETRVFGLHTWLVDGYRQRWMHEMTDIWRTRREGWLLSGVVITGLAAIEGLVVGLVAWNAASGHVALGHAVVLVQAVLGAAVLGTYNEGHWLLSDCAQTLTRIDEVEAAGVPGLGLPFEDRPLPEPAPTPSPALPVQTMPRETIRFADVRFGYPGRDELVFDGLDLTIEAGRSLAVVGSNGAGKTTLVKLLCRLYEPTAGVITVDGVDVGDLDAEQWRSRIAAVFQDFVQFELSAYDNVAYGSLANRNDAAGVAEAARLAGADALVARLAKGWDTPLSREFSEGTQLSGGEWQRLALARALFAVRSGAGVLILDEPTAALDVRGEAEVYERFLELTRGATTIVISHRFSTVRRADRIVVIDGGRVIEDGSHEELLAAGGRYAHMYWLQASRFDGREPSGDREPLDA